MAGPLLATKLHVPRRRRGSVPRRRLDALLDRGDEAALTLVSAPAGFGKTTLLTQWLAGSPGGRATAWLSLDQRDSDPALFWTYLLAALESAADGLGAAARSLLESRAPVDDVLAVLVNDLAAVPGELVLVLDDYHVVEGPAVHAGVAFLLEHLPPQVHLVIATRADPPLPLARLRARGDLVEVRAADLRFTPEETATYLGEAMGLSLPAEAVGALAGRTEGWIAALQLAALSMQGRDDVAGFVAGFAGDDRYVVDYLVEEVLSRQPDEVRDFLLRTSVLSRLSGPLCDAVVGRDGSGAVLEALDRGNLFVVPLDDARRWYRYHHLFADVLRARLLEELPAEVAGLHRRASAWYERAGEAAEAIRHAVAGGDPQRAADLLELAVPAMRRDRQEVTLRHWLELLPDDVVRQRPHLSVVHAGVRLAQGDLDGVEELLRDAERGLDAPGERGQDRLLRCEIAVHRAGQARMTGDLAGTLAHARRVLDLAAEDDHLPRGSAAGLLGLAHWSAGELAEAHRWWVLSRAALEAAGHAADTLGAALALAGIETAQGRLDDARATYERGLATARRGDDRPLRGAADMHVGLGELSAERGDLEAARRHLSASAELGEHAGLPQNRYRRRVATARVLQADGDLDGALELLDEAEQLYVGDMFPDVRPIAALRARVQIAQGRVAEALRWARRRGLSVDDDLGYLREFEHVTLARALLAQAVASGDADAASGVTRFLQRLLAAAEAGGRGGTVVELLVLQALAEQARGDVPAALDVLDRALTLAEPQDRVRLFLDEGRPMAALLRGLAGRTASPGSVRRLLAAFPAEDGGAPARSGLVEPLSARELDVLRLLGTDLDGPAIARELFVSLNTVRTHTKNIYAKLGVTSRRAAVRRSAELALLPRGPER
jgi:LuxR family transcriptional regulator, maltose regulon positive regulatory protein